MESFLNLIVSKESAEIFCFVKAGIDDSAENQIPAIALGFEG